jgi:hypothetical protein
MTQDLDPEALRKLRRNRWPASHNQAWPRDSAAPAGLCLALLIPCELTWAHLCLLAGSDETLLCVNGE